MCLGWRFSDSKTCLWNYDSFLGTVGYHPSSGRIFWVNNNKSYHLLGEWIPHMEIWDLYSPHMSPEKCITSSPFSMWDDCYPKRSNSLLKVMEVVSGKADPFSSPPGPSPRAALKGERETVRAPRLGACAASRRRVNSLQPCTVARPVPPSVKFFRRECWSGLPFPSPGGLSNLGIEPVSPMSPAWQADVSPAEPLGKPRDEDIKIPRLGIFGEISSAIPYFRESKILNFLSEHCQLKWNL